MGLTDIKEIGPKYDAGLDSPSYAKLGLYLKPGSFSKDLQTQLRDDVIAALGTAIGDRDLAFWKRESQNDWSQGEGQEYFTNPSRYSRSSSLDVHTPGQLRLVPQPTRLRQQTAPLGGRGGVYCKGNCFFSWVPNFYTWVNPGLVSNIQPTTAIGNINDIVTDGATVFFAMQNAANVYQTPGAVPVALAAYDAGPFYGRLVYDQLKKKLYGSDAPVTGNCRFYSVNAGAAATTIYDFLVGRLDALEMHQGNVVLGWNDAFGVIGSPGFIGHSRIFKYDGTNMTLLADMPDGLMILGLKSALGILFVLCAEQDVLDTSNFPTSNLSLYAIVNNSITKIGTQKSGRVVDSAGGFFINIGAFTMALAIGPQVFFPTTGHVARYDTETGGLSQSLGDDGVPALAVTFAIADMSGIALMPVGGLFCLINDGTGLNRGGVFNLHGTVNGIIPSFSALGTGKLTSSRIDAGLPYVPKFWHVLHTIFTPIVAGESVEMEYSIDDGATWVVCANSPFNTVGQKEALFTVRSVNPHIRYRVRPVASAGGSKGPYIYSVSARYAVVNANGSVYKMTVSAADSIRGRGNAIDQPGYGKETLLYLDNIARKNELVTFYEPDDSSRTPHTCWVVSLKRPMVNTGSEYDPRKAEGEVDLVLWEAV